MPYSPAKKYLYNAWYDMVHRCDDPQHPAYKDYGGRGIKVCPQWRSNFEQFCKDVGPRPSTQHSIERIDNQRGYGPRNVRWATKSEQANNRRSNCLLTYQGRTQTAVQWARELFPHNPHRIQTRLCKGWPVERALTTPIRHKRRAAVSSLGN